MPATKQKEKIDDLETRSLNTNDEAKNIIKKEKEKISNANDYTVTLNIFPDTYSIVAPSILEALKQMQPTRWGKGIASISIEHAGKKYQSQLHLTPWRWRMIFEKPVNMEFFVKRLKTRI